MKEPQNIEQEWAAALAEPILKGCVYYEEYRKTIQRKPIGRKTYPPQVSIAPYCTHTDSPVTREDATGVIGGAKLLKCGGYRGKCQLNTPPDESAFPHHFPGAGQSKLS